MSMRHMNSEVRNDDSNGRDRSESPRQWNNRSVSPRPNNRWSKPLCFVCKSPNHLQAQCPNKASVNYIEEENEGNAPGMSEYGQAEHPEIF